MAGLPQWPPPQWIPGVGAPVPFVDPNVDGPGAPGGALGVPLPPAAAAPAPMPGPGVPPPVAPELAGAPGGEPAAPAWPPSHWEPTPATSLPGVPAPGQAYQNQDVPLVEGGRGLELQAKPGAKPAPGAAPPVPPPPPTGPPQDPYVAELNRAADQRKAGMVAEGDAAAQKAEFLARSGKAAADEGLQAVRDYESARRDAAKAIAVKREQLTKEATELGNVRTKNRVWADEGLPGKVGIGVAAVLAGIQAVRTGGTNQVIDMVDKMIEQDLERQRMDLQTRKDSLGMKMNLLGEEAAAGRDDADATFKAKMAGLEMVKSAYQAEAGKYDSPITRGKILQGVADVDSAQAQLIHGYTQGQEDRAARSAQQAFENRLAKGQLGVAQYNAQTARYGAEQEAQARRDAADSKAAGKQFPFRGNDGQVMGYATSEKEQDEARQTVVAKGKLDVLYKRGRELFKDGWAVRGSEERARQDAWNQDWAMARRHASGDHSAPNKDDQKNWGLDTSATITNQNMAVLDEGYNIARDNGASVLRSAGVPDEALKAQGYMAPPPAPTPGKTDNLVYFDEKTKTYNAEGRGTPMSPEQSQRLRENPNYAIEDGSAAHGVWYDAETKTYNVKGIGERLSPAAEEQVRAQPDKFPINRGP